MKNVNHNRITKTLKKWTAAVLILCFITTLNACGFSDEPEVRAKDTVFTFAGENITLGEVYLYANTVKEDYESVYGSGIWGVDISVARDKSANMEDVTRRDIIEDIVHVKLLASKATDFKCALNEDEAKAVSKEADDFYENLTDQQIQDMQLEYDLIQKVMQENALAKKVYNTIIDKAGIEVSDEDARMTTFYDLYFECYAVASSGDVTKFSEDEKQAQFERALQAYNTLINPIESGVNDGTSSTSPNSTNIEGLAEYYGLTNSAYYTMTPSEIKGIYGNEIADKLYDLEDGSYSLVTESEYGYHIFYMKALTDRDATDQRKTELIVGKRRSYMGTKYSEWLQTEDPNFSYEKSVDFNVYYGIKF
ncbi:MAG: hypothetical protein K6B68_01475 [Eubacterium sp.]|nr:hypothetical protein [Eubacterium sp.]